jgi:hydroxymethylpyrimidine pyrophosphatase-like HAD family hydrolase
MAAPQYRFILSFDFDGTLVHPEGSQFRFHPGMGEMLRQLQGQGAALVINTGRSLSQTLTGIGQYGMFIKPDFIIAQECEIYKPGWFSQWVDFGPWNKQARKAHQRFMKQHQTFLDDIRCLVETQTKGQFLTGDLGEVGIVAHSDEELDEVCQHIEQYSARQPDIGYHRNGIYLRFSHAGYSKGSALAELARLLGLSSAQCFAAGDNYNDLSMLDPRIAQMIACPGNALPAIKAHVQRHGGYVAQSEASTGMMEALTHYFSRR